VKIVHICSYYTEPLAKGYQVYQLAKTQITSGHEVSIVTCNREMELEEYKAYARKVNEHSYLDSSFSETGATIHRLHVKFSLFGRNWWKGLKKKMIELAPDLLIVHNILDFQSVRVLYFSEQLRCRLIFDDHTTFNIARKGMVSNFMYSIFRLFWAKKLYDRAEKIIGISHSCMEILENKFGLKGAKLSMISLGSDTDIFYPDNRKRKAYREKVNVDENTLVVVYSGKINHFKKVHLIIEALNLINKENKMDITILIAGFMEPEYANYFEAKISESINPLIQLGHVNQTVLADIYNAADIAVWPAHTTTSTLDASACGCPIICSEYKRERYKSNNGFGIKDGDLESLTIALDKLIKDPELRREMGRNGVELVRNEFSWQEISRRFLC
jgi:glycosyltransferase involved in cell wall biosynthesis